MLIALAITQTAFGQERYREEAVKAAFLYRFAGYIEWPPEALNAEHFTIAVLGSGQIATELERLLPARSIKDLPAQVKRINRLNQLEDAQILFISSRHPQSTASIVRALRSKPVLVVTDRPNGLDEGSVINFLSIDRRVRFEISVAAAQKAKLKVGAELLSVAARVRGAPERADRPCTSFENCACRDQCLAYALVP